jgi:hypothetical protein
MGLGGSARTISAMALALGVHFHISVFRLKNVHRGSGYACWGCLYLTVFVSYASYISGFSSLVFTYELV